jgi:hypothetical protein
MVRGPSRSHSRTMRSNLDRLFYIEGALTMFTVLVAAFVLPDFPFTSHRWLSPVEVGSAKKRMEEDAGVGDEGQIEGKCSDGLESYKHGIEVCYSSHSQRAYLTYPPVTPDLYHHLPFIQRVLPHPHCYARA